ncbi:MAG: PAS domain-containing protein [Rhodospirillales bacterium]|nr:PAS domain-containing protein [Rhodospirillales bacterium]
MAKYAVTPTKKEVFFGTQEIIVSKTDLKGRITYANDVFCKIAGYKEAELLGQPHSILRHPDMPRCVFKFLWDTIQNGHECFAYVKNMTKHGDFYWVFAHVTPSFNAGGQIIGYHSSRRCPDRDPINIVEPIYKQLLDIENASANSKEGMNEALATLVKICKEKGMSYEELVLTISR